MASTLKKLTAHVSFSPVAAGPPLFREASGILISADQLLSPPSPSFSVPSIATPTWTSLDQSLVFFR